MLGLAYASSHCLHNADQHDVPVTNIDCIGCTWEPLYSDFMLLLRSNDPQHWDRVNLDVPIQDYEINNMRDMNI